MVRVVATVSSRRSFKSQKQIGQPLLSLETEGPGKEKDGKATLNRDVKNSYCNAFRLFWLFSLCVLVGFLEEKSMKSVHVCSNHVFCMLSIC